MNDNNGPAVCRPVAGLLAALITALIAGCGVISSTPDVDDDWKSLLADVRDYQRRIGFEKLDSFAEFDEAGERQTFCGYSSRYELPYSYQDPAIRWLASVTEEDCRNLSHGYDTHFSSVEALGETGAPVTPSMISGRFDRFLYLVIHEDCHDEFDLPYGIEEALCNLVTFEAMPAFGNEKYSRFAGQNRALRRYAEEQLRATHATIATYARLEALHARYRGKQISGDALLQERVAVLGDAAPALGWHDGSHSVIRLANDMTYSRHYPLLERAHVALGRDLAKTMAFFKHVDRVKPSPQAVMKRHKLRDEKSLAFIKAYEAAIVETIKAELAKAGG